jgi:glutamate-5-semialdehyde dehydrogenase
MIEFLEKTKEARKTVANLNADVKNSVLLEMADALESQRESIKEANAIDMKNGEENKLSSALMDRLFLDDTRIGGMAKALREIAGQKDPVGRTLDGWITENGLNIQKVAVPIGVIAIIYESRPNVTSDTAGLCFKSGNVCLLKGGKEAMYSNEAVAKVLQSVLEKNSLPKEIVSMFPDVSREGVEKLIKQDKYIDLIIPRGGEKLIKFVNENATVPVVKHDKGLCHVYIDQFANIQKAIDIALNAKVQRPGVCNAAETLIIHEQIATDLLPLLKAEFDKHGTLLKGDESTRKIIDIETANDEDFHTEYLDNILSIKTVSNIDEAISHIANYGSGHSESIITENYTNANKFLDQVDSACVYVNASTRFTDGGAFGMGAEVGISTNRLHSRGPMGIEDLTTYKFKILGDGHIR